MKKIITSLLLVVCILILGCTKKQTTSPESGDDYTLEAVETIGPGGGTLETDDFSLSVPAGAFDAGCELSLYMTSEDDGFGDNCVTRSFQLLGLPDEYSKPLRVGIEYEGALSGESFVALGEWTYDAMSGDTIKVYCFQPAVDSSGYLVAEMPARIHESSTNPNVLERSNKQMIDPFDAILLIGMTRVRTATPSPHFEIRYPEYLEANVPALKQALEYDYYVIESELGFRFDFNSEKADWRWEWPMWVSVCGAFSKHAAGIEEWKAIDINSTSMEQARFSDIQQDAGPVLLGFLLECYVGYVNFHDDAAYRWLCIAAMTWSEERFTDDTNYQHPRYFPGNEMAPFRGMRAGAGPEEIRYEEDKDADIHGRGMSAVIKYLVDDPRFDVRGLTNTFESIKDNEDPITTLINRVDGRVEDWWPDFYQKYVGGKIYNVGSSVFMQSKYLSGTWDINTDTDTEKVFGSAEVGEYPDLSAKLFLVNLNHTSIDASANLILNVNGETEREALTTIAFVLKNGTLEYLGQPNASTGDLEIQGLRNYIDNGWRQFLVVVVNSTHIPPYTGTTAINLIMSVGSDEGSIFPYTRCLPSGRVYALLERVKQNETSETWEDFGIGTWGKYIQGSMKGNEFIGHCFEGFTIAQLTAIFSPSGDKLVFFSWDAFWDDEIGGTMRNTVSGTNLPRRSEDENRVRYNVFGPDAINHITSVEGYYANDSDNDLADWKRTVKQFVCNETSSISITFYKD